MTFRGKKPEVKKAVPVVKKSQSVSRSSTPNSFVNAQKSLSYKASEFARTRLLQELELVFKEYVKSREVENNKSSLPFQRL